MILFSQGLVRLETYQVLIFTVVAHSCGNTASCKASIDGVWLDVHLQHEVVANLSAGDVVAVGVADPHTARWRRSRVGDRARRGQHRHVEADGDVLRAGVVDTADSVGL